MNIRPGWITAFVLLGLLFAVPAAAQPIGGGPPRDSNGPRDAVLPWNITGGGDEESPWPSIVARPRVPVALAGEPAGDGIALASGAWFAWSSGSTARHDIVLGAAAPGRAARTAVAAHDIAATDGPTLTTGPGGGLAVAYTRGLGAARRLVARTIDPQTLAAGPERELSPLAGAVAVARATLAADGTLLAARAVRHHGRLTVEVGSAADGFTAVADAPDLEGFTLALVPRADGSLHLWWLAADGVWGSATREAGGAWGAPCYAPVTARR